MSVGEGASSSARQGSQSESEEKGEGAWREGGSNATASLQEDSNASSAHEATETIDLDGATYVDDCKETRQESNANSTLPREGNGGDSGASSGGAALLRSVGEPGGVVLCNLASKWLKMADPDADFETRRFHLFVGVLLSSRCRYEVVRTAVAKLRRREGGLTMEAVSSWSADEAAALVSTVHYNKAKGQNLVESAQAIRSRHSGCVPRQEMELRALPGIGAALAKLFVAVDGYATKYYGRAQGWSKN
ncbi:unnamed protein product [Phaeothamnion confervicola]